MSHDIQLSPAASHPPAATRPSPPSAGQSPRRQPAAADGRTEATGQARDTATPQKSALSGHCPASGETIPAGVSADDPDVLRLGSLLALRDVELDLLPFLQAAVAAPGDRAEVGSPGGISPPGSHGTERESLPSLRSSHLIHQ